MSEADAGQGGPLGFLAGGEVKPILQWPAESVIIASTASVYMLPDGHEAVNLECVICGDTAAGEPFELHTLIDPRPCDAGSNHLASITGMTHIGCNPGDDVKLAHIIAAKTESCW